ncbi:hypothetical protein HY490_05280 [Candidatus Woesearchaeota archaeon]|nr:hypothetical protein [Candidatus Woesearchaeota archaeon]
MKQRNNQSNEVCEFARGAHSANFGFMYVVVLLLLLSQSVTALGVRPAKTNAHFIPEATGSYTITIVNDEHRDMLVSLEATGAIADLIVFPQKSIEVKADQDIVSAEFQLAFPEQMAPGDYAGNVVISEQALGYITQGGISARLQLLHKVNVNVPIQGKYLVANLALRELKPETINVITDLKNEGFENINNITSQVKIFVNSSVYQELPIDAGALTVQENLRFEHVLEKARLEEGAYTVLAEITYDNARLELSKKPHIGIPQILVKNSDPYIITGKINKWDVELNGIWNEALVGQSFDGILTKVGQQIIRWKTLSFDLVPGELKQVRSYIDATTLPPGEYEVQLVSNTEVGLINSSRALKIITEEEAKTKEPLSPYTIIALLIIIIMIHITAVVALIVWQRKKTGDAF